MTKLLVKSKWFILIFLFFVLVSLYFISDKYFDNREVSNYKSGKINNSVVIIGDSRSQQGINDSILKSHFKKQIFNLSVSSYLPLNNLNLIKDISIKNSIIFIAFSTRQFLNKDTFTIEKKRNRPIDLFNYNLYSFLKNYFFEITPGTWEYIKQPSGGVLYKNLKRKYLEYSLSIDSINCFYNLNRMDFNQTTNFKLNHILELYKTLARNGNKVYFIDLPERKNFRKWMVNYDNYLKTQVLKSNIGIYNFGYYDDSYFYDSHHLNKLGAYSFTLELCNFFK